MHIIYIMVIAQTQQNDRDEGKGDNDMLPLPGIIKKSNPGNCPT